VIPAKRPTGWDHVLRRLLPNWFLSSWGQEVTELLQSEESAARARGRSALLRFRVMTVADLVRAGWQTRRQLGAGFSGDVRLALRLFRRSPGFTTVAILSLAIGVTLSATAFSVLDPAYSRPLPYPEADRLLSVRVAVLQGESERRRLPSWDQFRTWQSEAAAAPSVEVLAAYHRRFQQQDAPGGVEDPFNDVLVQTVSPEFLSLLGARTSRGRLLMPEDHRAGAPPAVLISEGFWKRKFDGSPGVLGAQVKVRGDAYTVVGVAAPDFHFGSQAADVIRPLVRGTGSEPAPGDVVEVIARHQHGAAPDRVAAELGAVINKDRARDSRATSVALVESIRTRLYGSAVTSFGPFAGGAALLLLLVTANVANLTLVRASGRRQEMTLRTALGAGRGRLARLVAIEAGLLTVAACALGLLTSWWTIDLLTIFDPLGMGGMHPVFDLRVALFGGAVAAVAGALAALWPGLSAVGQKRMSALRQGPQQGSDSPRQRLSQRALVMCQIACALVVLTGAGLLTKTVLRMQSYDPGINTHHLLTAELDLPPTTGDGKGNLLMVNRLLDELRAIPGVMSAGIVSASDMSAGDPIAVQSEPGVARETKVGSTDRIVQISPGYLEALGVPVVSGRMLTPEEFHGTHQVVLVNEEAVRRWWSGKGDITGARIKLGSLDSPAAWATVVGVIRNTGPLSVQFVASDPVARVFVPVAKTGSSMLLFARTAGDPLAVLPELHTRAQTLDRRVRILMPSDARASLEWGVERHVDTATFVGALAAFGLLLAAMGIYGVTTYAVARRMREIGIRKALGAGTGHVLLTVGREAAGLALGGIAIGLATSAGVTRLMGAMLYGTSPIDASVFAGASLVILAIVALATWVPLRTALQVDPVTTLRCD